MSRTETCSRVERLGFPDIDVAMADDDTPADQLSKTNAAMADWAARSAAQSDALIERFEGMGYEVRGKSADEIAEILKHPPTKSAKS